LPDNPTKAGQEEIIGSLRHDTEAHVEISLGDSVELPKFGTAGAKRSLAIKSKLSLRTGSAKHSNAFSLFPSIALKQAIS
jgi:hypothetical protein